MTDFDCIRPSLIQQIKKILDQYPDDGQILKELIQNAEDAGATEVKFLFDHHSYGTETLHTTGMAKFQGPALYAYNNAKFSDKDWKGVRMLSDSFKEKDPTKVGRFGLGFKSVFHITDLPSVISGDSLAIIDPQEKYFSDDEGKRSGRRWHLRDHKGIMEKISDQFSPYKNVFNCTDESFEEGNYEGTLFRLPLRQEASKLSETIYSQEKVKDLLCFEKDAHLILLFLMNLERIEVYERDECSRKPRKLFHVAISNDCLQVVRDARKEFSAKVKNNISALSNGCFSEVKNTFTLTIETVHYDDGETVDRMLDHTFVITNLFSGNDVSAQWKELIVNLSSSYMPYVGVALPLTTEADKDFEEPKGHLFCVLPLPLPLENRSLTGLPVHVNGFFALSQNRRHLKWASADSSNQSSTDKSVLWNNGLLHEVLPKAYAELILHATSCLSKGNSYGAWPNINKVDLKWRGVLQILSKILLRNKVLHSDASGGVWCRVEDVILDNLERSDQAREIVIDLLNRTGRKVVTVPAHVKSSLQQYSSCTIEYVTPKIVRNTLKMNPTCYTDLSHQHKILLLKFVLGDSLFDALEGLELLPLSDKTFTTFRRRSKPIYIDSAEHPKSLLPGLQGMFLDTELDDDDVTEQMIKVVNEGQTQLCHFDNHAVKHHFRQTLPSHWLGSQERVTWCPGKPDQPTVDWLKALWLYFGKHFNDLEAFTGLPLVPVTPLITHSEVQLARIQRPSSLVLSSFNGECIEESMCDVLKALGLTILNDLPDFIQHYRGLVPTLANPASPNGVLNAMRVFINMFQKTIDLIQRIRELPADKIRSLRAFLSTATLNERHLLQQLPLFETYVGCPGEERSRFVSLNEVNVGAPIDDLPSVNVFTDLLDLRDRSSRALAMTLGIVSVSHTDFLKILLDDALRNKYPDRDVDILVKYSLERFGVLHGEDFKCIKQKLQCLSFVVSSDNSRKKPTELFNPEVDLLRQVFLHEDVFPKESYYSQTEVKDHLKKLGLKLEEDITISDVATSANMINAMKDIEKAVIKSEGLLRLLEKYPNLLQIPSLRSIIWIPVLNTRPKTYSKFLSLKGCETGAFASPNDATSCEFLNLVGSVKPLVDTGSNVSKHFGLNQKPYTKDVLRHLRNVVLCYSVEDKSRFISIVKEIYGYLSNVAIKEVQNELRELQMSEWVWTGDGFCGLSEIVLENPCINLTPYVCVLPTETRECSLLFTRCGMKRECDTDVLLEVLSRIKIKHDSESNLNRYDVKHDLHLAIDILNELKPESAGEFFDKDLKERLLIPVHVGDDSKLEMKAIEECTYCDHEWLKQGYDISNIDDTDDIEIKFIHPNIPNTTADILGIPTLMSRILGAEEVEMGESFGQHESLLDRLRGLLEGYTDGLSVPKELIQNADDAGATEVRFLYDERANEDFMTRLIDEGMKECQGPAIWAYNNAVFSDEDFQNIVKLNSATKREDSSKIGRFGLGFNSVYNLTDVPSFVSRNYIVILDPHTTYLGKGIRDKSKPGIKLKLEEKKLRRLANQFKPYNGIFGCDLRPEAQSQLYNGTLFRFPLRTANQALKSDIKKLYYDGQQVKELFGILCHGAESLLLFTQNVLQVTVYHLKDECTESPKPIELFRISKSCSNIIHRLKSEVSLSKPCQELTSKDQEFVSQSSILKASSVLMKGLMNGNFNSSIPQVLVKSSLLLNCHCVITLSGTQFFAQALEGTQSSWLVTSCMVSGKALKMSLRNKGLLPTAGVAAKLTEAFIPVPITMTTHHNEVFHQNNSLRHNGNVFCFLPLPIHNGLPIHINSCFAVSDNRRYLRERTEEDKIDHGAEWNDVLMKEVVCQAYISLLEDLKHLPSKYGHQFHSLWPRSRDVQTNSHGLATQFYISLFSGIPGLNGSSRMPDLFSTGNTWSDVRNVVFLEPAFRNNALIGQAALDILRTSSQGTKTIVVDLPEEIFQSFESYGLQCEVQKKCYNKERFFREVFFPTIGSIHARLREKLVIYVLDDTSEELRELVRNYRCIPSSPLGSQLKCPKELLHPMGKAAELFSPEDERFPYGENFISDERLVKLRRLGMREDDLEWNEVLERAESIGSRVLYQDALERTKLLLAFIDRKLDHDSELDKEVQGKLQQIRFLPILKKPDAFPLTWKGDEYAPNTFLSAGELYPRELKYLAGVSVPILDDSRNGCGLLQDKVKKILFVQKEATLEQVKMQLKSAIVAKEALHNNKSFEELKKALDKIYYYFQCSLKENLKDVVDFLKPLNFILVGKQFLSCARVTFSKEIDFSPYLCPVGESYNLKFRELFKTVGVRESFDVHDYIKTLKEVKHTYKENPITKELNKVVTVLKLLADEMVKTNITAAEAKASIFIPDSKGVMKPSTDVCVKDCMWMPDEKGVTYANESIPPKVCIKLGANTRRQETLRKYESLQNPFGIPFGQKEKLTNRLKRILKGYPCDKSVMKELLQNADDAQATKLCFIKDPRQHPNERVFEECWKPLQGPALCVYNNAPFTKRDIQGIQNLGEGSKGDDPNKTGQYGVGFNAVYHITDVPTFISQGDEIGEVLCVFDPNLRFAPGANESKPGVMYHNITDLKDIFSDVFPCYLGEHFPINNGTMFRFPLRDENMASESKICKTSTTQENLDELLDSFKKEILEALLFVNNVKEVSLCEIKKETGTMVEIYNVKASISKEDEKKRQNFAAHVSKIGRGLQSGELSIADIPRHDVSYVLDLEDKAGQFQKWFVVQKIGFESSDGIPDIIDKAFKKGDLGLLPRGGVASLISLSESKPPGKAFCFLPLPFETGLPVHINGHFALDHEARRSLWRDDRGDYRSSWNDTLLRRVIAPCYVTLLDEVRQLISLTVESDRTYLNCSREEAEDLLDSRYTILFPSFPKSDMYWETLAKEVYRYMDANDSRLLPVLRQVASEKQISFCIEWLPPTGQGIDKAFFGNLIQKLPNEFETLDDKKKAIEKKKSRSLTDTLLSVGFNLLFMPMRIYELFKGSSVDANVVSAADVIHFFATYNSDTQLCNVGTLPLHIRDTPFKSVFNLLTVLKYCKENENFFNLLHGLPLLLTQDEVLRVFDLSLPVFQSGYYMLLPKSSSSFLHHEVYSYIFPLKEDKSVLSAVFKVFDIAAFASLLPKELKEDDYKTSNKYITWKPDGHPISSNWIWHVWRFFSNFLENVVNELDRKQEQCDENKRIYCNLKYEEKERIKKQQHLKNITEKKRMIQEALAPVINWCLVPVTVSEKSGTSYSSNIKYFLVPLAMVETVICFKEVPYLLRSLKETLDKMALPELNCKVLGSYEIAKQLVANLSSPCSVLSVLLHKLNVDPKSMDGLDQFYCSRVLRYFNDYIALLDSKDAETLRVLPFFTTIHGKAICIKKMQAVVLSDSIPKDDMNIWQEQSRIVFLKEVPELRELYSFLGCDSKDAIDLYCDIIFEKFHEMSEQARLTHLEFLRQLVNSSVFYYPEDMVNIKNKNKERLVEELRWLRFIPDSDGNLKTASAFYDPSHTVFSALFESKQDVFPPVPFREDNEWLSFLRKIGLVHQVSNEMFVQFAKEVEAEAKHRRSDATKKKSDTLVRHLFQIENVGTNHLLNDVKEICFVFPLSVCRRLQNLHKQYGMKQNNLPYICFKDSVASGETFIAWTSTNFLPSNANPCNHVFNIKHSRAIFQQLGIIEKPTVDMVVAHCKNLCKVLFQGNIAQNQLDETKEREKCLQDSSLILDIMTDIYKYLDRNYKDNEEAINELKDIRCLVVDQGNYFVYPYQVAIDIMSDQEIKPYLYKIPNNVTAYAELFEKLGSTNTVTAAQYSMVLDNIHDECGNEKLHPNEIRNAFKATKGLFETIGKMQKDQVAEIPALFLPGEKANGESEILVFLQRSTEIVFNDAPNFKDRVKCFEKLLLVKLQKCGLEASNDELLVNKLPVSIRPRMLTSLVHETLVEGKQSISCSSTAQELREILTSGEFCHGLIRMIRHSSYESGVNISSDILATVRQKLSCIFVYSVSNLRTRLVYNGETIPESEANVSCFGEKEEGEVETWKIYVAEGAHLQKYFSRVAIIVNRMTGSLLGKDMLIHLPIMLSIMPCEMKSFLDDLGIREDNSLEAEPPSYLPSAGTFIHIEDHHLLVDAFVIFSPGDYIGYELDDPSLRGEGGTPTYIYAVIIEDVTEDGHPSCTEPSLRRYKIDIGKDKEPIIVDAADLYMFKRSSKLRNQCLELYSGPSSDKSKQTENLGEILNQITRILEEAWKLPIEKRRKIIKRLFLTWHPDKNPGNEEFCKKIFQFIQEKIEKLEKGISFGKWKYSSYSYSGCYGQFFNRWSDRARNHRSQSSSFYRGGGFSTFSRASYRRNPQPGEARRWYNQAKADLDAASNDVHYQRASYEWACFKCHQSAEKALKAAQYSKDADKTSTHSLTALAQELNSSTLQSLASELERVVGNSMRTRYPDQVTPPSIPHDVYGKESASRAMDIASSIIREVESKFI